MPGKRKQPKKTTPKTGRHHSVLEAAQKSAIDALFDGLLDSVRLGPHGSEREMVNHPAHYGGDTTYEVVKVLEAWGLETDALLWNAIKYIARAGKKSAATLPDLLKAQWYLNRRVANLQRAATPGQRETNKSY